jgi:hypothetical protein
MTTLCETCGGRGCWTCHHKGSVEAGGEATRYEVVKVTDEPCACCREVQWVAAGPLSYAEAVAWISKKVDWHPYDIRCRVTGRFLSFQVRAEVGTEAVA